VRAVEPDAILAVLLRPVERGVREPDQLVASVTLHGEGGAARADRHIAAVIEIQRADSFDDRIRSRQGRTFVVFNEQEGEGGPSGSALSGKAGPPCRSFPGT